jgi:hypothetical protein
MSLIILGIMVLCGASMKAIGIAAIVLGVVKIIEVLIPKVSIFF